ncbi:DUF6707 family protein [Galactobacter caseinivorans]|uniref:Uncharacterized protein n=1 Tax=Galactobacter caseinivorans TaxID=2676123 RepID=A0A496PHD9_9MICC|nr:DUF6707 family protein [Galactobacter caseinivorans]RKW69895.1 hypothetical protein DWQ67_10490 [Galactobacter caseinivorans]
MPVRFDGEAPRHRRSVSARQISAGDRFMRRNGKPSVAVKSVRVVRDSFGTDAYVEAQLMDGVRVTIAIASSIRVYTERAAGPGFSDLIALPTEAGTAEAALVAAVQAYPEDGELLDTALRLAPGINPRAGAHLVDLAWAADRLVVEHGDTEAGMPLLAALTVLSFDGNEGRWRAVRHGLALSAWLARQQGVMDAAAELGARIRRGEEEALEDMRGPVAAIRRRELSNPVFPEREIQKARDTGAIQDERQLRLTRLDLLLAQLATGWAGLNEAELTRLISAELAALGPGGGASVI